MKWLVKGMLINRKDSFSITERKFGRKVILENNNITFRHSMSAFTLTIKTFTDHR